MQTEATTETRHTPGPWIVDRLHRGDVQTADGREVCSVWSAEDKGTVHTVGAGGGRFVPDEDCDANARLIASAPEMYEAATPIVDQIKFYPPSQGEDDDEEVPVRLGDLKALRAALSRARGEG